MSDQALVWEIKKKPGETLVVFVGDVDERTDFAPLEKLAGPVTFDLAGIKRVNSEGVRRWINFLRRLTQVDPLVFARCSIPIITQINMIPDFQGRAEVRSFYAPYLCPNTGHEEERLLLRSDLPDPRNPPTFPCEGGEMELDDIPERYFSFLMD